VFCSIVLRFQVGQLSTIKIAFGTDCSSANPATGGLMKRESAFRIRASAPGKTGMARSTQSGHSRRFLDYPLPDIA
jgi:hypothetical protein